MAVHQQVVDQGLFRQVPRCAQAPVLAQQFRRAHRIGLLVQQFFGRQSRPVSQTVTHPDIDALGDEIDGL